MKTGHHLLWGIVVLAIAVIGFTAITGDFQAMFAYVGLLALVAIVVVAALS